MKGIQIFFTVIGLLLLISACSSDRSVSENTSLESKSQYGDLPSKFSEGETTIEVYTDKQVYTLPVDEIVLLIENSGTTSIGFGEPRYLEKLKDGMWYQIPYDSLAFGDIGLSIEPGNVDEQEMPLEYLDYRLTEGTYRIPKTFHVNSKTESLEDAELIVLASEFEIEE